MGTRAGNRLKEISIGKVTQVMKKQPEHDVNVMQRFDSDFNIQKEHK
jgi:hypothetical protein